MARSADARSRPRAAPYGSTEVAVATVATPEDWRNAPGTAGRPPVGSRVALYAEDAARISAANVPGRIFVGDDLGFRSYTGGGAAEQIDGLLSTGDLGHLDATGLLFIDGRSDEMITSGGENVFPAEVEHALLAHPAVKDAAVVGVPDPDFGHRLRAFVVAADGVELSEDDVRAHVRSTLARHKVPRGVLFCDTLPRNATGKISRTDLPSDGRNRP